MVVACALMMTGRFADAAAHFVELLKVRPNHADAYQYLGLSLQQLGKIPEAITCYENALRLNSALPLARENLEKLRSAASGVAPR
jgi:Flp pilus assembly protein TadD